MYGPPHYKVCVSDPNKIVVGKTWVKVEAFINKELGMTPKKSEVIRERKRSETTQRSLDWWEEIA